MHSVSWDVKRVAQQFARVGRHLTERWGLTPARFDMLFSMKCQRQYWFPQRRLRELLGNCASTISRMIDALVKRGFLIKRQVEGDKRRNELALTKHGKPTVRCMFRNLIRSGPARRIAGHAIADYPDDAPTSQRKICAVIKTFAQTMDSMKRNLEDPACFDYGSAGELRQPRPAQIEDRILRDREFWPGDEGPLTWRLERV